ncbi:uncharacterized protein LOC110740736 [Papio anubis]|uniref:uncharacterized protein LOC110740736 n=1 Tax=Papio anubis TaxID=9555 RepID=UPI0012AD3B87|nr:uncharacterized protein LOC110740736 [Papio anubis]
MTHESVILSSCDAAIFTMWSPRSLEKVAKLWKKSYQTHTQLYMQVPIKIAAYILLVRSGHMTFHRTQGPGNTVYGWATLTSNHSSRGNRSPNLWKSANLFHQFEMYYPELHSVSCHSALRSQLNCHFSREVFTETQKKSDLLYVLRALYLPNQLKKKKKTSKICIHHFISAQDEQLIDGVRAVEGECHKKTILFMENFTLLSVLAM